jgi:hypothetical protein
VLRSHRTMQELVDHLPTLHAAPRDVGTRAWSGTTGWPGGAVARPTARPTPTCSSTS